MTTIADDLIGLAHDADILIHEVADLGYLKRHGMAGEALQRMAALHTGVTEVGAVAELAEVREPILHHYLWCATRATSLRNGLVNAVRLGGDTDTVAALVGGLVGGKLTAEQVRGELPWHRLVVLPEPENAIADTAAALATARAIQSL